MKDAFAKAKPILMEPVMAVEVSSPEEYQGDLMGDISRRRGQIQKIESKNNLAVVRANVPLAEMFGYSTAIRTLSSGRASYSMTPSHFEQVPPNIVDVIVHERTGR
jgi:elongation factor G